MTRFFSVVFFFLTGTAAFAQGNCNEADLAWIAINPDALADLGLECGLGCAFDADPETCVFNCVQAATPLSDQCISCFVEQVNCAQAECFVTCLFGTEEECAQCVFDSCGDDFNACAGIEDADGDTWTTLSDCDDNNFDINPGATEIWYDGIDQNCDQLSDFDQDMDGDDAVEYGGTDCNDLDPNTFGDAVLYFVDADMDGYGLNGSGFYACAQPPGTVLVEGDCNDEIDVIYEGAPGTFSGLDNDCNGTVEGDEVFDCPADLNNDGFHDTSDILALLGQFGCEVDCEADVDGDDAVGTSDLLEFLAVFGTPCF